MIILKVCYIILIVLSFLLSFSCISCKDTEKDSGDGKVLDDLISVPSILDDDSISLETSTLNRDGMIEITNMISKNTMTGVGNTYSLQDTNKISPVKQLRKCINTEEAYNVYITERGRFYVFYDIYSSISYQAVFCCYSEKILLFSDFDGIRIGVSTIEDIRKIDETKEYIDNGLFRPQKVVNGETVLYEDYSIHMTKEGIISIGYKNIDGKLLVDYINEQKDERISEINALDLP